MQNDGNANEATDDATDAAYAPADATIAPADDASNASDAPTDATITTSAAVGSIPRKEIIKMGHIFLLLMTQTIIYYVTM